MEKQKIGKGLVTGGTLGVIMCVIAEIFLFKNRLREVETQALTVLGSNEVRIITVGIENWFPLFILALFMMAFSFFLISIGFRLMKQ